jgi:hypothetical protein
MIYIAYTSLNCVKHRLCKYLMYILTEYRPILTKDTKDQPNLSSERADLSLSALQNWSLVPDGRLTPRRTECRRNVTLTLVWK